jgi:hypothetical protein
VEKAAKGKQLPTQEDIKVVMPNKKMPMNAQKKIGMARAMTGQGRSINNMMNPATRMSPYRNSQ